MATKTKARKRTRKWPKIKIEPATASEILADHNITAAEMRRVRRIVAAVRASEAKAEPRRKVRRAVAK